MSNNKQSSSIDFFWNQLPEILPFTVGTETAVKLLEAFEQAKAMHKEECIKYYVDGVDYGDMGQHIRESLIQIAEKIYNETFGGNNEQH